MSRTPSVHPPADEASPTTGGSLLCLPALLVSLVGLVSSFIAYDPGAMTWDSFVMWGMGWKWPWHDWHSPYIPLLMGVSRRLFGDPSGLLLFQLFLSWGGLYLTACGLRGRSRVGAALLPLLGFTPMFLVLSGYLHKTPLQTSVFLFVFGALYYQHQVTRRLPLGSMLGLILLLLLGIPLREYGLVCGLPLSAFLFYCRHRRLGRRPIVAYLVAAAALSGASFAIHHLVVYHVVDALKLHKIQTLYRYDLAAIYALTGDEFAPRLLRPEYASHEAMRALYERDQGMWMVIYAYEGGIPEGYAVPKDVPERLLTEEEVAYYRAAWLEALKRHPGPWLEHKGRALATSLGLTMDMFGFRRARFYRDRQNVYGLKKRGGVLYRSLKWYMTRVGNSLALKPWLWLLVASCVLVLGSWISTFRPSCRAALAPILVLSSSALLLYPQLFLTSLDNDLRFTYWATVSSALSLLLFVAILLGPSPEKRRGSQKGD